MSPHAIRYYCDQNFVPFLERDEHNIRLFNEEAKLWLRNVKYMRKCGMSIEEIRHYVELNKIGIDTIDERFSMLLEQKQILQEKMLELQESFDFLENKIEFYQKIWSNKKEITVLKLKFYL